MIDAANAAGTFDRIRAASAGRALSTWLLAVLVSVATYLVLVRPYISTQSVLGDLGDARFNLYILEHTFRYLTGLEASYQSPEMFYPFPGTLLFSDTHVGSVPFYMLFRVLGASPFTAFTWWVFTGYLLTFSAAYYAFLRLGFAELPAVVAAVVFSFSLPCLAQVGHAQLTYRAGIPLAFLSLWTFFLSGSLRDGCLIVIWTGYQLLCSVYLGVFLLLLLAVSAVISVLVNRDVCPPSELLSKIIQDGRRFSTAEAIRCAVAAAVVVAVVVLLYAHHRWAAMYGLGRHWSETETMIPRPQSYLLMNILPYWNVIYSTLIGLSVPVAHEQNLFMGVGALGFFLVGSAATLSGDLPPYLVRLSKVAILTLACLVVLMTKFGSVNLYYYISVLPGLNAIRAVARAGIVMMFPAALIVGAGTHVMLGSRPRLPAMTLLGLLAASVAAEIFMSERSSFRIDDADIRVETIVNNALDRSAGIEKPILFVHEGDEPGYKVHLDAMFAAQRLGWPTVNGYSGSGVPGSDYRPDCDSPARQAGAYQVWRKARGLGPELSGQNLMSRLVAVGWPDCGNMRTIGADGLGPAPKPKLALKISLIPVSLDTQQSKVTFQIAVRNEGDERLVVHSFRPVRLSWRFVRGGMKVEKGLGWDTREQLIHDVVPHSQSLVTVTADLPRQPGDYLLEVSLVSELAYWFHDNGMGILQFEKPLFVR